MPFAAPDAKFAAGFHGCVGSRVGGGAVNMPPPSLSSSLMPSPAPPSSPVEARAFSSLAAAIAVNSTTSASGVPAVPVPAPAAPASPAGVAALAGVAASAAAAGLASSIALSNCRHKTPQVARSGVASVYVFEHNRACNAVRAHQRVRRSCLRGRRVKTRAPRMQHMAQSDAPRLLGNSRGGGWAHASGLQPSYATESTVRKKNNAEKKLSPLDSCCCTFLERESAANSHVVMTASRTPPRYGVDAWRDPVARKRPWECERKEKAGGAIKIKDPWERLRDVEILCRHVLEVSLGQPPTLPREQKPRLNRKAFHHTRGSHACACQASIRIFAWFSSFFHSPLELSGPHGYTYRCT